MKLDVCICTHNPRRDIFQRVLEAIARQTLPADSFHVWIIDNSSTPPLGQTDIEPLRQAGVAHSLILETRLGNVFARDRAIQSTSQPWVVFVDDDNELEADYLVNVIEIIQQNPHFGCFGGKLLLPENLSAQVPDWMRPLLPFLAIKDKGDEVISNCVNYWGEWEPPTAGAAVHRSVLNLYVENLKNAKQSAQLGRKGKKGLLSAEDSLMMRSACKLNLHCSYQPRLRLWHHIDSNRLNFRYLLRLLYNYGRSQVILERSLGHHVPRGKFRDFWRLITNFPKSREKTIRLAWQWGHFFESRRKSPPSLPNAASPLVNDEKSVPAADVSRS